MSHSLYVRRLSSFQPPRERNKIVEFNSRSMILAVKRRIFFQRPPRPDFEGQNLERPELERQRAVAGTLHRSTLRRAAGKIHDARAASALECEFRLLRVRRRA